MSASILVIEDDPEMQALLVESLEDVGYSAQGAGSADKAFEAVKRFQFDLVISDIRMAGSTDGLGALEILKKRQPNLRCIVITGFAGNSEPGRAVTLAVDDYVYKPFKLPAFLATVKRVLNPPKTRYGDFLNSILSAPKRLLEKIEASRQESVMGELRHNRDGCYQGLYISIRSKMLRKGAALEVWDKLEELEFSDLGLSDLAQRYRAVHLRLASLANNQLFGDPKARDQNSIDRNLFNRFYDRIQSGELLPEHVTTAARLRLAPPSGEQSLADFVWGAR